jgi:hypothetical protein
VHAGWMHVLLPWPPSPCRNRRLSLIVELDHVDISRFTLLVFGWQSVCN